MPRFLAQVRRKKRSQILKRRRKMDSFNLFASQTLGTVFYTICVFVAGAWVGPKFFGWVGKFLPWNKD